MQELIIDKDEFKINLKNNKAEYEKARHDYLKALAENEVVVKIDKQVKNFVLDHNEFNKSKEWRENEDRILSCDEDYLMTDDDFKKYMKLCHEERLHRGMQVPSEELSSDYLTRTIMEQKEKEFVAIVLKTLPKSMSEQFKNVKYYYNIYKKFLDLCLRVKLDD
jgi:hypothetical protein